MSKKQTSNDHEQRIIETYMKRLQANQHSTLTHDERPIERYDFNFRTDQILVPSKWVARLEEKNAVDNYFQYLREKIEDDTPKEVAKIDREALYCSTALHKIRQNTFHKHLTEHQARWRPVTLIGEIASELPKPTTDPNEIQKQLYMSLLNKK